jgi:NADPH:quinone reductase
MQAVTISTFGGPDAIEVTDVPVPEPGPGEVRVRVQAAAVHPVDLGVRAGAFAALLPSRPRYVLGWDAAGIVEALGPGVTTFRPGDAVVGMTIWLQSLAGTQAELAVLPAGALAAAPRGASPEEAASLPLNALAAAQALDLLPAGTRSLAIAGAGGALGAYATELGVRRGLAVSAVADGQDEPFLRERGARFVPRSPEPSAAIIEAAGGQVDAVLDTAGLGASALAAVRDGGGFVSTLPPSTPPPERGIQVQALEVVADGAQLAELVALAEQGNLTLRVAERYALADAAAAHARLEQGGVRGRLVLTP